MTPPDDPAAHDEPATLAAVRAEIDALDRALVELLAARQGLVRRAAALKADPEAVRAVDRQRAMLADRRRWAAELGVDPRVVEATFTAMVGAFVELELGVHEAGR